MSVRTLRQELPPIPALMAHLPVHRGYPVPWFTAWVEGGVQVPAGMGEPDFRFMSEGKVEQAIAQSLCWVCGRPLFDTSMQPYAFVSGPMCGVNRTSAEPPSHIACADWSARACPFLTRPHAKRRDPAEELGGKPPAGHAIMRNPGVALVWISKTAQAYHLAPEQVADRPGANPGVLLQMGEPIRVRWYCEGRPALREEVLESVEGGLPKLRELAEQQGPDAMTELERMQAVFMELVPA